MRAAPFASRLLLPVWQDIGRRSGRAVCLHSTTAPVNVRGRITEATELTAQGTAWRTRLQAPSRRFLLLTNAKGFFPYCGLAQNGDYLQTQCLVPFSCTRTPCAEVIVVG